MIDNILTCFICGKDIAELEAENVKLKLERETAMLNWEEGNKEIERLNMVVYHLQLQLSDERLAFEHANEIVEKLENDLNASKWIWNIKLQWQLGVITISGWYLVKMISGAMGVRLYDKDEIPAFYWAGPIQPPQDIKEEK